MAYNLYSRVTMIAELAKYHEPVYSEEFFTRLTDKALKNWYDVMQRGKNLKATRAQVSKPLPI